MQEVREGEKDWKEREVLLSRRTQGYRIVLGSHLVSMIEAFYFSKHTNFAMMNHA